MPRDIALLEGPPAHLFEGPDKPVGTLMGTLLVTQWTDSLRLEKERQGRVMALRSNGERIAVRDAKEVLFRLIAAVGNPQAKGHDQITLGQNASAFYEMQEYLVARLGGDEFLIIMEGIHDPATASRIADKILDDLRANPVTLEQEFFIGASLGISLFPQDGTDSATLIKNAVKFIDKAVTKGVIKRGTASRYISRLTRRAS